MVEKSQDIEMDKSVAVGNVENNSEKFFSVVYECPQGRSLGSEHLLTYGKNC